MGTRHAICVLAVSLFAIAAATAVSQLERDDIIETVNSAKTTWKAGRNFHPSLTRSYINHLAGVLERPNGPVNSLPEYTRPVTAVLPDTFDLRKQWKNCSGLQTVRDQGPCGSCWAVAAVSAFSDRLCIATHGAVDIQLSAEQLLSCCSYCGGGCKGGFPDDTWKYFKRTGIVTGGDYQSGKGCQPYTLPTCEHHTTGARKNCDDYGYVPTPDCASDCYNTAYKTPYKSDFHKVKSTFKLKKVIEMQQEIYENGPLEASFYLYEDFLSYKSGVYQHVTGASVGKHAVKIIGWGEEDGTPYWLVANSWNTDWGNGGFFKMLRGSNMCHFESDVSGGLPDV